MSNDINTIKETIAGDYSQLSRVSILRHLQDIIAVATWHLENLFGLHKAEMQALMDSQVPGTIGWYRAKALAFQYGDTLTLVDYRPGYETIDEEKQIIKYAHVSEQLYDVVVKVAKEDREERLSTAEKEAFEAYLDAIKHPGTHIIIVDQDADRMTMGVDVFVDPQLINSSGQLISNTSVYPVKEAIEAYINESEFGGVLTVNALVDAIQAVDGVLKVRLLNLEADTATSEHTVIFNLASGIDLTEYESEAGHFIIDEEDLTINYQ